MATNCNRSDEELEDETTPADSELWDGVSFVISSQYRVTVLKQLAVGPSTPSQIEAATGISISHVSRALGRLRDQSLVELLVSEDRRKGRVYGITERGADVWQTARTLEDDQ